MYSHTATTVPMDLATHQRVNVKDHVTITPGCATRKPTQIRPHIIPNDTEARAPLTHPYDGKSGNIPPVNRYNTRARRMQGHNLMSNHIATVQLLNPPNEAVHTYLVQKSGEDWAHTKNTTGYVTIQPGRMNAVTRLDTGNPNNTGT